MRTESISLVPALPESGQHAMLLEVCKTAATIFPMTLRDLNTLDTLDLHLSSGLVCPASKATCSAIQLSVQQRGTLSDPAMDELASA